MLPPIARLCAAYKVFNAGLYLAWSLHSIYDTVDRIVVFVSTKPWNGPLVPMDDTEAIVRTFPDPLNKIRCVVSDFRYETHPASPFTNELTEMNALLDFVRAEYPDITHYLYLDADEVFQPKAIATVRLLMRAMPEVGEFRCAWRCYWKSFRHWIDPVEPARPLVAFRLTAATRFTGIRDTNMEPRVVMPPDEMVLHHFSYALPAARVREKIQAWSHSGEIVEGWFEHVWLAWDGNRAMENLHPVSPAHFKRAVAADEAALPAVMTTHPFYGRDIV